MGKNFVETKVDWKATLGKIGVGENMNIQESSVNLESLRTAASYMKRTYDMEFSVNKYNEEETGLMMVSVKRNK